MGIQLELDLKERPQTAKSHQKTMIQDQTVEGARRAAQEDAYHFAAFTKDQQASSDAALVASLATICTC